MFFYYINMHISMFLKKNTQGIILIVQKAGCDV